MSRVFSGAILGILIFAALMPESWSRHGRGLARLRDCVARAPMQPISSDISMKYLISCASSSLPEIAGSPQEKLVMEWLLDANLKERPQYLLLKINLATIAGPKPSVTAWAMGGVAVIIVLSVLSVAVLGTIIRQFRRPDRVTFGPGPHGVPRILLIDDDGAFSSAVARYLSSQGILVDSAKTVAGAMRLLRRHSYDRIFCDYELDQSDGLKLCDSLAEDVRDRCVIVSGYSKEQIYGKSEIRYQTLEKPCLGKDLLRLSRAA